MIYEIKEGSTPKHTLKKDFTMQTKTKADLVNIGGKVDVPVDFALELADLTFRLQALYNRKNPKPTVIEVDCYEF